MADRPGTSSGSSTAGPANGSKRSRAQLDEEQEPAGNPVPPLTLENVTSEALFESRKIIGQLKEINLQQMNKIRQKYLQFSLNQEKCYIFLRDGKAKFHLEYQDHLIETSKLNCALLLMQFFYANYQEPKIQKMNAKAASDSFEVSGILNGYYFVPVTGKSKDLYIVSWKIPREYALVTLKSKSRLEKIAKILKLNAADIAHIKKLLERFETRRFEIGPRRSTNSRANSTDESTSRLYFYKQKFRVSQSPSTISEDENNAKEVGDTVATGSVEEKLPKSVAQKEQIDPAAQSTSQSMDTTSGGNQEFSEEEMDTDDEERNETAPVASPHSEVNTSSNDNVDDDQDEADQTVNADATDEQKPTESVDAPKEQINPVSESTSQSMDTTSGGNQEFSQEEMDTDDDERNETAPEASPHSEVNTSSNDNLDDDEGEADQTVNADATSGQKPTESVTSEVQINLSSIVTSSSANGNVNETVINSSSFAMMHVQPLLEHKESESVSPILADKTTVVPEELPIMTKSSSSTVEVDTNGAPSSNAEVFVGNEMNTSGAQSPIGKGLSGGQMIATNTSGTDPEGQSHELDKTAVSPSAKSLLPDQTLSEQSSKDSVGLSSKEEPHAPQHQVGETSQNGHREVDGSLATKQKSMSNAKDDTVNLNVAHGLAGQFLDSHSGQTCSSNMDVEVNQKHTGASTLNWESVPISGSDNCLVQYEEPTDMQIVNESQPNELSRLLDSMEQSGESNKAGLHDQNGQLTKASNPTSDNQNDALLQVDADKQSLHQHGELQKAQVQTGSNEQNVSREMDTPLDNNPSPNDELDLSDPIFVSDPFNPFIHLEELHHSDLMGGLDDLLEPLAEQVYSPPIPTYEEFETNPPGVPEEIDIDAGPQDIPYLPYGNYTAE